MSRYFSEIPFHLPEDVRGSEGRRVRHGLPGGEGIRAEEPEDRERAAGRGGRVQDRRFPVLPVRGGRSRRNVHGGGKELFFFDDFNRARSTKPNERSFRESNDVLISIGSSVSSA